MIALVLAGLDLGSPVRVAVNRTTRRGRSLMLISLLVLPLLLLVMVAEFLYLTALG
jgi:hypothetical protein